MTDNPVFHDKLKHIEIKYHFIQDMVQKGAIKLKYVPTEEQVVDVLTNPLARVNFETFEIILVYSERTSLKRDCDSRCCMQW